MLELEELPVVDLDLSNDWKLPAVGEGEGGGARGGDAVSARLNLPVSTCSKLDCQCARAQFSSVHVLFYFPDSALFIHFFWTSKGPLYPGVSTFCSASVPASVSTLFK